MSDSDCIALLQWALPRLGLHWPGFRKVRRQVCKRIVRRACSLGLPDLAAYRARLEADGGEWGVLSGLCTVSISRFYRDRGVFDALGTQVLPALAQASRVRGAERVDAWSAGCASGEEAYTLLLLWRFELQALFPELRLDVLGTDLDPVLVARARKACYATSSLEALPEDWRSSAFEPQGRQLCLREAFRAGAEFALQDLRTDLPQRTFDLILCRNLAFTYFGHLLAQQTLGKLISRLRPAGALVIGLHERLPEGPISLSPWQRCRAIYLLSLS